MTPAEALRIVEGNCALLFDSHGEQKAWDQRQAFTMLRNEIERLRAALQAAEDADQKAINCTEHEPEMAPESCGKCFPSADDARLKRWAALGINQPTETKV